MQRTPNNNIPKIIQYRTYSPVRSPMRNPQRPLSPIRNSPFSRQAPMSPLRARKLDKSSATPTKTRICRDEFHRSPRNNHCRTQYVESYALERRAIKSGVGLFQQLVNQQKIGSERKENRYVSHCVTPFQLVDKSDRKKSQDRKIDHKSSYGLIQVPKQDQSVNTLKPSFNNSHTASKVDRMSHLESTVKIQYGNPMKQHINILDSFGAPKYSQNSENSAFSKLAAKVCQIAVSVHPEEDNPEQKNAYMPEPQHEPISSFTQKEKPAVGSSYEEILLLLNRAGEYRREESMEQEQNVKNSLKCQNVSFNMNPFI